MAKTKVHGEYLKDSVVRFTAKAGENITKGQAVYISGVSGEKPVVSLADANDTAKMPAFGLAEATVSTNAEVEITSFGTLKGLDTSSFSLGDILYVDTTAGSLTNNPSGLEATKLQNIGIVQRVHATSGSIKVGGAGRTNAVPNLDDGDIFIGDSNNKAVSDSFTNVLNTEAGINSSADATAITIDSSEKATFSNSIEATNAYRAYDSVAATYRNVLRYDSGNVRLETGSGGSEAITAFTAGSERMRIDSSGIVGIGNTVAGTIHGVSTVSNLVVGTGSGNNGIGVYSGSSNLGAITFADGTSGNTTYRGGITYNHSTDHLELNGNGGTAHVIVHSSGVTSIPNGVELGSGLDATAANTLDDYEEGTWTASAGNGEITMNSGGGGEYTKIGNIVYFTLQVGIHKNSSSSNQLQISGLPFSGTGGILQFTRFEPTGIAYQWINGSISGTSIYFTRPAGTAPGTSGGTNNNAGQVLQVDDISTTTNSALQGVKAYGWYKV